MASNVSANVTKLQHAGLIDAAYLTAEDVKLIDRFTAPEIDMMIRIAKKADPDDPQVLKLASLRSGRLRMCLPL